MKDSRHEKSGAGSLVAFAQTRLRAGPMDLALVATTVLMYTTMTTAAQLTIFCFHVIFVLLTFGAFFWDFRAFVWRAVFWVVVDTAAVLIAAIAGSLPYDELTEIPLLSTILVLVFLIARRRTEAQARLQEKDEAFLGAVLENMEDAVVACDAEGRLAFSNPAARARHGLPEEDLPLLSWIDHFDLRTEGGARVAEADIPIFRALRGDRITDEEFVISPKNGPERCLLVSGNRMVDRLGQTFGAVVVMRDITERKRAEQRLIEVQENERERIARDLHDAVLQDLSWALRKIEYNRKTGLEAALESTGATQVVTAMRRAVQGVRNSIYDLHPRDISKHPFAALVVSALELNRGLSPEIEFESVVANGFPRKLARPVDTEVLRIIQEALVNARRHSHASRVRVVLQSTEEDLQVRIEDNGAGFEADMAPGLGISGMKERAERIGGKLKIRSYPGEGTAVCLALPRTPSTRRDLEDGEVSDPRDRAPREFTRPHL